MATEYCFQTPPPNKRKAKASSNSSSSVPSSSGESEQKSNSASRSGSSNTVNKAQFKKVQSQLKGFVSNFGEFIVIWKNDNEQMQLLFESILSLYQTIQSINSVYFTSSTWRHRIFEDLKDSGDANSTFNDLHQRLIGKVLLDLEPLYSQLKTFQKHMADVQLAMTMKVEEMMKTVIGQPIDSFDDPEVIFHTDHALHMQNIHKMIGAENARKIALLIEFFHELGKHSVFLPNHPLVNYVENIVEQWSCASMHSYLDTLQVESFLIQNNIS